MQLPCRRLWLGSVNKQMPGNKPTEQNVSSDPQKLTVVRSSKQTSPCHLTEVTRRCCTCYDIGQKHSLPVTGVTFSTHRQKVKTMYQNKLNNLQGQCLFKDCQVTSKSIPLIVNFLKQKVRSPLSPFQLCASRKSEITTEVPLRPSAGVPDTESSPCRAVSPQVRIPSKRTNK